MRVEASRLRQVRDVVALVVVAAVSLTACSGGGDSTGNGSSPSKTAPDTSSPGGDPALKVPAPLPAQALLSNPCSALTDAELKDVGLTPPGELTQGPPALCDWSSLSTKQNGVGVGAVPQNKGGISDIYDQRAKQAYFQPVTVDGYPGVFADTQDGRPSGSCSLWVGITDQLAFTVVTSITIGPNKAQPCDVARKVGTAVVTHLRGAA
ncbi:DUF3558 domain-containing protein [Amycolatopsis sp. PS_44_ISF1]|uniref:DUF3558 domain-containing protein n=1 Tax=Amycolatopsis sp. PS_44_ISF1 TaxID=2974917 RepID=UPI0028E032C7|nr:DUF3558 domain-containing protein [Amycolatopsis sp. PS_44_ISF1]MDT8911014.1 DUF3558 domain-containing protein [Amycolatopsis sp. PS_44_ISF1]